MTTTLSALQEWVDSVAALTKPDNIYWCDGSEAENARLTAEMVETGVLSPLNPETYPDCYLHLSDPSDVARVEHLTFVCTQEEEDAGPNNNWMAPADAHEKIDALFDGAMKGRTLYVIPYCMGPLESLFADETITQLTIEGFDSVSVQRVGVPAARLQAHFESNAHLMTLLERLDRRRVVPRLGGPERSVLRERVGRGYERMDPKRRSTAGHL